jgi:MFS family permease
LATKPIREFYACAAFISFPTALLAEYVRKPEQRTTAVAVYSGTLAVTAIFFTILWLYAAGNYRLVDRNLHPALLRSMTRRYVVGMALYILAFALAFINVVVTLLLIVGLALLFVLPEPDERPRKTVRRIKPYTVVRTRPPKTRSRTRVGKPQERPSRG